MKIMVYFLNGMKAVFEESEAVFVPAERYPARVGSENYPLDGKSLINRDTVCYVKEYVDRDPYEE